MPHVRKVDRSGARRYLKKADEFLRAGSTALQKEDWNASGLASIHAGISAMDSYLVAEHGVRSTAADHTESIRLLRRLGGPGISDRASALERLIAKKSLVEYEDRLFTAREAREAFVRAERLVAWARETTRGR